MVSKDFVQKDKSSLLKDLRTHSSNADGSICAQMIHFINAQFTLQKMFRLHITIDDLNKETHS